MLLTALPGDHPDVTSAISLGAFAHLVKPMQTEDVKKVLNRLAMEQGRMGRIR